MLSDTNTVRGFLSFTIIGLIAALTVMLFFLQPPDGSREMLSMSYGALLTQLKEATGFFFGSSDESTKKPSMRDDEVPPAKQNNTSPPRPPKPGPF